MITQGNSVPAARGRGGALLVGALLAGAAAVLYVAGRDAAPTRGSARGGASTGPIDDLTLLAEAPDVPDTRARVAELLRSDRPEARAAATAWIGRHPNPNVSPLIVPRLSDADWRVRAAAFEALPSVVAAPGHPTTAPPLRDTPVDQREPLIFAWLQSWRGSNTSPLPEPCELYAPAGGHWLSGLALARSCTSCHAPPSPYPAESFVACASCHGAAHEDWARSSHARSMTHVNLARVNERTKQVERFIPEGREGPVCTSCHAPDESPRTRATPPGTQSLFVPHRFQTAALSCAQCHPETRAEWEAWKAAPRRPSASRWLPGEVTWDESPEQRTCVSCHMGERRDAAGDAGIGLNHLFAARRDASLLRGGLSIHLEPPTPGRGARLVLTNLAGHRYPSGTVRRALRIELRYDTDAQGTRRLLTRLADSTVPTTQPTQPALAPAEQRRFDLPTVPGASRVTCEVTFERNQFEPGAYELPLHTVSERLTR